MTPSQQLKREILLAANRLYDYEIPENINDQNVDSLYSELEQEDWIRDAQEEVRYTGEASGICRAHGPEFFSVQRHYESEEVAKKMDDGSCVGWTYWHGGGKFGCPQDIPWVEHAYAVDCVEEEKTVIVRTYSVKG